MLTRLQWQWLAVGFLVIATLFSGYFSFFVKPQKDLLRADSVTRWEERMQSLREALPPSVREVGYLSDNEITAIVQEYVLTQYALAPVVVRRSAELEWIVGNFTQPDFQDVLEQKIPSDFTIQKIGAGIYLIHRSNP
jgi:hypothetical protein